MAAKIKWVILLTFLGLGLSGCSMLAKLQVHDAKLPNGRPVKYGTASPTPDWQCKLLTRQAYEKDKKLSLGLFKGPYAQMKNRAFNYAASNNLNVNYIFIRLPGKYTVNGVNLKRNMLGEAFFYRCLHIDPTKLTFVKSVNYGVKVGE